MRNLIIALFIVFAAGVSQAYGQSYFEKQAETGELQKDPRGAPKLPYFDKDTSYDIYYEVSAYEVHRVDNIRIIDVRGINGVPFVVVQYSGYAERIGYIRLASIKAIIPTRAAKPNRSLDILRQYQ
ncbi:MAG: hypothetical protein MJA29_05365 [Candidatus Omnitrophica bacterium]|nr:hypothetical protein [Candidatus Omnitrophota bacterium]